MEAAKFLEKIQGMEDDSSAVPFTGALLLQLQESVRNFPGYEDPDRYPGSIPNLTINSFNFCRRDPKNFKTTSFINLVDGLSIFWNTRNLLEDRSHRLNIPKTGNEFSYNRGSYNVDIQALGSKALNLYGTEQIAEALPLVVNDLVNVVGAATFASDRGWVGTNEGFGRYVRC